MKYIKLGLVTLIFTALFYSPSPAPLLAQSNSDEIYSEGASFTYIDVEPPNFQFIKNPNTDEKIKVTVRSNLKQLFPRGFDWDKKSPGLNFSYSDWLKIPRRTLDLPDAAQATHSFTLDIPESAEPGEYYKMMTYSNQPYSCEESDNPPVMVGVPINTLVVKGIPVTDSPASLEELHKQLHADLYSTGLESYFSLLNQSQNFKFTITNDGNLRAYFTGYILVKNRAGETIEKLDFDQGVYSLEPKNSVNIDLEFIRSKQLAGSYTAELYLSYKDSLYEYPLTMIDRVDFTFVGAYVLLDFTRIYGLTVLAFLILRQLSTRYVRTKLAFRILPYYIIILAAVPAFLYSAYNYSKSGNVQGTVNSGTETVGITAVVRESTALKVNTIDGRRLVKIVSQNNRKGWELWSFNCNSTRLITTDKDFGSEDVKEILLDETASSFPILLISRFF